MDFTTIIKTVAPWIGTALGGPLGGLAVEAAANALGLGDKTTDALKQAISGATPEQLLALKNADQQFQLRMQELGYAQIKDLEAIAAEDRKDARTMQRETHSKIPALLSIIVTIGYFGILISMMTETVEIKDSQALMLMLGSLSSAWGMVLAFWFGTTAGSNRKTDLLAQSAPAK